jgi:hypothetical protein
MGHMEGNEFTKVKSLSQEQKQEYSKAVQQQHVLR